MNKTEERTEYISRAKKQKELENHGLFFPHSYLFESVFSEEDFKEMMDSAEKIIAVGNHRKMFYDSFYHAFCPS